jgi:hypothetical protein
MYVCERCRRRVRPASEPGIVFAVELEQLGTRGATIEYVETVSGFFHEHCFPTGPARWRRRLMPAGIDDGDGES